MSASFDLAGEYDRLLAEGRDPEVALVLAEARAFAAQPGLPCRPTVVWARARAPGTRPTLARGGPDPGGG